MMAYVIIKEGAIWQGFVNKRTKILRAFKEKILNDEYATQIFWEDRRVWVSIQSIPKYCKRVCSKEVYDTLGTWSYPHLDGSHAVMALTHLAMMTGNIGKMDRAYASSWAE